MLCQDLITDLSHLPSGLVLISRLQFALRLCSSTYLNDCRRRACSSGERLVNDLYLKAKHKIYSQTERAG